MRNLISKYKYDILLATAITTAATAESIVNFLTAII